MRHHYLPLLDMQFLDLYKSMGYYPSDLRFTVNGQAVIPSNIERDFSLDMVKKFFPTRVGKRIGYGVLGLAASEYPAGGDVCGVLLCTYGKVIKADLFNQFPGSLGPRIFGLVEIPKFVNFLTTAKTDFIRGRGKHREFESLYNPVRVEFKNWLAALGIQSLDIGGTDEAEKLERELKKLVKDVPELADFFGFRAKKDVLQANDSGPIKADIQEGTEETFPIGEGNGGDGPSPVDVGNEPGEALVQNQEKGNETAAPISRTGRRGPKIAFAEAPTRVDLAWVDGNSVVINSGHPSYVKARTDSTARRLHSLFAIGSAIQRFLAGEGEAQDLMFLDKMMAAWGKR